MLRHLLIFVAVLPVACSSGEYQVASVSGQVTVNGKAVEKVAVMFQPVAVEGNINPGPGSYGITNSDGRYYLKLIGKETKGAVVGKHKVRIENYTEPDDPSDDRPRKRPKPAVQIPAKYNAIEARLECDVPAGGRKDADFALTSP